MKIPEIGIEEYCRKESAACGEDARIVPEQILEVSSFSEIPQSVSKEFPTFYLQQCHKITCKKLRRTYGKEGDTDGGISGSNISMAHGKRYQ